MERWTTICFFTICRIVDRILFQIGDLFVLSIAIGSQIDKAVGKKTPALQIRNGHTALSDGYLVKYPRRWGVFSFIRR